MHYCTIMTLRSRKQWFEAHVLWPCSSHHTQGVYFWIQICMPYATCCLNIYMKLSVSRKKMLESVNAGKDLPDSVTSRLSAHCSVKYNYRYICGTWACLLKSWAGNHVILWRFDQPIRSFCSDNVIFIIDILISYYDALEGIYKLNLIKILDWIFNKLIDVSFHLLFITYYPPPNNIINNN